MRRFLLIASAAIIALIGLSANQCSGGKEDKAEPAQTEAPAAKPDDSGNMGSDSDNKGSDSGNMGSDSDTGETPSE